MRIGVASLGQDLEADVSERFGRCPFFLIVESDSGSFEAITNAAATMPGGAGPAAVQQLADRSVQVAIAGEFGPKAQRALDLAGIRQIQTLGPVREALKKV